MLHLLGEDNAIAAMATQKGQEALADCAASLHQLQAASTVTLMRGEALAGRMTESITKAQQTLRALPALQSQASANKIACIHQRLKVPGPRAEPRKSGRRRASRGRSATEGTMRYLSSRGTSSASSSATATPAQSRAPSLEPAYASLQLPGESRRHRRLKRLLRSALKSSKAAGKKQSCLSSTTKQVSVADGCASQKMMENLGAAHQATERSMQQTPAGCATSSMFQRAETNRRNSCPAAPGASHAIKADTGTAAVETPPLMAQPAAPSTPIRLRRPQPVRTQAQQRPYSALSRATMNLVLEETEAPVQHHREREVASPSSVTRPSSRPCSRPCSSYKVQRGGVAAGSVVVPRDASRPSEVLLSALQQMSADEDLMQEKLHQSLTPRALRQSSLLYCCTPRGHQSQRCGKSTMSALGFERAKHAAELVAAAAARQPVEKSIARPATAPCMPRGRSHAAGTRKGAWYPRP